MNQQLARLFAERIAGGLKRKSITTCSQWAQAYRVMGQPYPGPWTFTHHPWLKEMHDSTAPMSVGQKAAQMGFTEWALNVTFFKIDVEGVSCLYVLPNQQPDATRFSAGRFDPALELSPHLSRLFPAVDNVSHKRAGAASLYLAGSKSRSALKSIPTGLIVLDEVDEMEQANIPLALERAAGQVEKMVLAISTPTIPNSGINLLYSESTQEHFFFRCPRCSRHTELVFPDCLVITAEEVADLAVKNSHLICKECKGTLVHEEKSSWLAKGKWVPSFTDRDRRGFHIPQLYSTTVKPYEFAQSYLRSLRNPAEEQEFHNSKLGLPHLVEGAGVTDKDLDACLADYRTYTAYTGRKVVTMGCDVGKWLHFEIDEWDVPGDIESVDLNVISNCRVLKAGKVKEFEELDKILRDYGVNACVIDANPERRKAHEFSSRNFGFVKLCFYGVGISGKQIHNGKDEDLEQCITVDRTSWLDLSLGRFRNGTIKLPIDIGQEYRRHLKAPVRVYEKDKTGNPIGRYVKAEKDEDHFAHARNYAEIALQMAMSLERHQDIADE